MAVSGSSTSTTTDTSRTHGTLRTAPTLSGHARVRPSSPIHQPSQRYAGSKNWSQLSEMNCGSCVSSYRVNRRPDAGKSQSSISYCNVPKHQGHCRLVSPMTTSHSPRRWSHPRSRHIGDVGGGLFRPEPTLSLMYSVVGVLAPRLDQHLWADRGLPRPLLPCSRKFPTPSTQVTDPSSLVGRSS